MSLTDFTYHLPAGLIAHQPASPRDHSRLALINRTTGKLSHHHFFDLPHLLPPRAVLVTNQSRVFPSRIYAEKPTGGRVEIFFLEPTGNSAWHALLQPGLPPGSALLLGKLRFEVLGNSNGIFTLKSPLPAPQLLDYLNTHGLVPIPPYIHPRQTQTQLKRQYQTVYAKESGSVAAPTAGLHFTHRLLKDLTNRGFDIHSVTLHVGLGTFKSPSPQQLKSGTLHRESIEISPETAVALNQAKIEGRPIIAVGTTAARTLESSLDDNGHLLPVHGSTTLFIKPPYRFRFIDGLITNFHLPGSSLLMLVSAFCSAPNTPAEFTDFKHNLIYTAYQQAIREKYHFYSFGDATFIY